MESLLEVFDLFFQKSHSFGRVGRSRSDLGVGFVQLTVFGQQLFYFRVGGGQVGVCVFKILFEFLNTLGGLSGGVFIGGVTAREFVNACLKISSLLFPIFGLGRTFAHAPPLALQHFSAFGLEH